MNKLKITLALTLVAGVPLASAQVVLNLDGQIVPLESQLSDITYIPGESRLEINTQWDDLRCVLNPEGPISTLPDPEPGDFVLALDYRPGDVLGEYVIEDDGSISQLLGAIQGDPVQLGIVTSDARINTCEGQACAVLVCTAGGTPVFSGDFETPPPPQVDLVASGTGNSTVVAGSGPNNAALIIAIANASLNDASNVIVDLGSTLPRGVTPGPVTPAVGNYNDTNGEWTIPALAAGASTTATLIYTVDANAPDQADFCASGSVASVDQDIVNTDDDSHEQCAAVDRQVDLTLIINNPSDPQTPGSVVNYLIELETNGPSDASNVTVDVAATLPADVSLTNSFTSVGTFNNGVWDLGDVPVSPSVTRTLNLFYTVGSAVADGSQMDITASIGSADETLINTADDAVSDSTGFSNP
ncbi:MAG: hypothetical protein AAGH65_10830 [Pseudomonadota bacterium]